MGRQLVVSSHWPGQGPMTGGVEAEGEGTGELGPLGLMLPEDTGAVPEPDGLDEPEADPVPEGLEEPEIDPDPEGLEEPEADPMPEGLDEPDTDPDPEGLDEPKGLPLPEMPLLADGLLEPDGRAEPLDGP